MSQNSFADPLLTPIGRDVADSLERSSVHIETRQDGSGLSELLMETGETRLDLVALVRDMQAAKTLGALKLVSDQDAGAVYDTARAASDENDLHTAAGLFVQLAASGPYRDSALLGLAATLCASGRWKDALAVARTLAMSGFSHPRAMLIAGYSAYKLGNTGMARKCLARAAQQSRGKPDYRGEMQFSQRLLLTQQFGG